MDDAGFRARRRADRLQREAARSQHGGIAATAPFTDDEQATRAEEEYQHHLRDKIHVPQQSGETGYEIPGYRPPPAVREDEIPGATSPGKGLQGTDTAPGPSIDDVKPSSHQRQMDPHLQVMCGPMLRYDTVVSDIWHGYALIVTSDTGSRYEPHPTLTLEWDDAQSTLEQSFKEKVQIKQEEHGVNKKVIPGDLIFTYNSLAGGQSFWRFKLEIPLASADEEIFYSINGGAERSFWIPGVGHNMRWVGHSCNGFSSGVDTDAFNGPDPLWNDVLKKHEEKPIHCLIGGGDQIYCDPLAREPEMAGWISNDNEHEKIAAPMTDEMKLGLDRFFFNHYCAWFRHGAFGRAISHIPMTNILDDHDLIDGFGSYPDDLQTSPVFSSIGSRGYFWYLLFQLFIVDDVDGTSPAPGAHTNKSMIIGGEAPYIPFPSHSLLCYLGPKVYMLLLDCRAERKKGQICSKLTYERCFDAMRRLPAGVEHVVLLLGVPIAYPRMTLMENALESKLNPLTILGKSGAFGLGGFVNKFNKDAELLDDLNDHWCASTHKHERNWFVKECQKLALERHFRITYLSGDVHCASASKFHSTKKTDPAKDPKYMLQVISSAIVNTPPPPAVIKMVSYLGKKRHKTLHDVNTDETMIELFKEDTDGSKPPSTTVLGRRNYALIDYLPESGDLRFDVRMEIKQGGGDTKGYALSAPPPRW